MNRKALAALLLATLATTGCATWFDQGRQAQRASVAQADFHPLGRGVGVKRQPGGASQGDGGLHHQRLGPARHPQANMLARRGAGLQQVMRRQAGARQQLTIAQAELTPIQRRPVGLAGGGGFQQVGQAGVSQKIRAGKSVQNHRAGVSRARGRRRPAGYDRQLLILAITPCGDCLFLE